MRTLFSSIPFVNARVENDDVQYITKNYPATLDYACNLFDSSLAYKTCSKKHFSVNKQ